MLQIAQSFLASSSDSSSAEDDDFLEVIVPYLQNCNSDSELNDLMKSCDDPPPKKRPKNAFVNQYFADIVNSSYIVDEDFISHFKIGRSSFEELLHNISSPVVSAGRPPISTKDSLLITIWTLLNQEPYRVICERFNISIGHCVRVYHDTCQKLLHISSKYIRWPTGEMARQTLLDFKNTEGNKLPNVFGCIGVTHLIIPSSQNDLTYYDQAGNNSIILQAVCDAKRQFININVGWPGSASYDKVWRHSLLYDLLKHNADFIPSGSYLIGDLKYPLDVFLMVPFPESTANNKQKLFNSKLCATALILNHAFGRLKGTFSRLRYLNITKIESVKSIAAAACVLHNLSIRDGVTSTECEIEVPTANAAELNFKNEVAIGFRNELMNQILSAS